MRILLIIFVLLPIKVIAADISKSASPTISAPQMDQIMAMATQAAIQAVPPQQMQQLSDCLHKYVDPKTAQNLSGAVMSGVPGSYEAAQSFQHSAQGQQAIAACQPQIAAITPIVMQELFKMMMDPNNSSLFMQ